MTPPNKESLVEKLALEWKTWCCKHFNGAYCEVCTAEDLATLSKQVRLKALEEAVQRFATAFREHEEPLIGVMYGLKAIRALEGARDG